MSTRSIIALPNGDAWKGRYCHSDGYPTWNGRVLFTEAQAMGVASFLEAMTGFLTDGEGEHGISNIKEGFMTAPVLDDWHQRVTGATHRVYKGRAGEEPMDWITPVGLNTDTEWCYVISQGGLMVGKCVATGNVWRDHVEFFTLIAWNATDVDWQAIEAQGYEVAEKFEVAA